MRPITTTQLAARVGWPPAAGQAGASHAKWQCGTPQLLGSVQLHAHSGAWHWVVQLTAAHMLGTALQSVSQAGHASVSH